MRWPFVTRTRLDRELALLTVSASDAIDREWSRATVEGRALVHAWAREVNYNLMTENNATAAKAKALAALQDAEHQFRPEPTSITEALNG